jgi:hypothetical protein
MVFAMRGGHRRHQPGIISNGVNAKHNRLAIAIGWFEEWRQGVGGGVRRMPHIGQAKGGFNRLQQRKVGVEAQRSP